MKNILIIAATIFLSGQAFASKARLTALGQKTGGSTLVKDSRSIFLNPAHIGQMANSFNFEMGNADTNNFPLAVGAPYSEGGMTYDMEGGKIGMQMGRRSDVNDFISGNAATVLSPKNSVDVIYGTKGAKAFGLGIHYASANDDEVSGGFPNQEASELQVFGGMVHNKLEVFGQIGINGEAENETAAGVTAKFDVKSFIMAGFGYDVDNVAKVFGSLKKYEHEATSGAGVKTETQSMDIAINYAHLRRPKSDVMMFYGAGLVLNNGDVELAGVKTDVTETSLPVFIGLEVNATSYMDLRASVRQMLLLNNTEDAAGDNQHSPNTTTVGAGAALKFNNNLVIDTTLGAEDGGDIDGTSLFANASMNYTF